MPTMTQITLRMMFYGLSIYTGYLMILLTRNHRKDIKKGKVKDSFAYALMSAILIIILGNIIILNIDVYDAILGTMEVHTCAYILLIIGGAGTVMHLQRAIKQKEL